MNDAFKKNLLSEKILYWNIFKDVIVMVIQLKLKLVCSGTLLKLVFFEAK